MGTNTKAKRGDNNRVAAFSGPLAAYPGPAGGEHTTMTDMDTTDGESIESDSMSGADAFIRGLIDAMSDPGEKAVPMLTTDAEEVIRSQLTENTGKHLLDSGMYGRAWEENRENPPWNRPRWDLTGGYPIENVYHRLAENVDRDRAAVALEVALYAYGRTGDRSGDSWLTTMKAFAGAERAPPAPEVREWVESAGYADGDDAEEYHRLVYDYLPGDVFDGEAFTVNTYNSEFADASQVLQLTAFGGPYAEYVAVQVHGGADVRGGYTAPRVYHLPYDGAVAIMGSEFFAHCERCGWEDAESVLWDDDRLLWQDEPDTPSAFREVIHRSDRSKYDRVSVHRSIRDARNDPTEKGVCIHADGCGGRVRWM